MQTRVVFIVTGVWLCGCASGGQLAVEQRQLSGPEQHLDLVASTAQFDLDSDGVVRYCLAFPLPGARSGRQFLLYLRTPASAGSSEMGQSLPDGRRVAGFFIQVSGRHKGLTEIAGGRIETADASTARRRIRLDLRCSDGTVLTGEFVAERDALALRDFEQRERPGDVLALLGLARPARGAGR